jgi:hypothetical protein
MDGCKTDDRQSFQVKMTRQNSVGLEQLRMAFRVPIRTTSPLSRSGSLPPKKRIGIGQALELDRVVP